MMTLWEANAAGYKPFVEWYRKEDHCCKHHGHNNFFHLWLDIWTQGPYGHAGEAIVVDLQPARPHSDEPYWWESPDLDWSTVKIAGINPHE